MHRCYKYSGVFLVNFLEYLVNIYNNTSHTHAYTHNSIIIYIIEKMWPFTGCCCVLYTNQIYFVKRPRLPIPMSLAIFEDTESLQQVI